MRWRYIFLLPVLAGLVAACSGNEQSGKTLVTVMIGSGKASPKAAYRPSVVSKATPTVAAVTFTITGSGMDDIVRTVPVTPPQTITEVFYLLNGLGRTITIEAKDGSNLLVYSGSVTLDLDGTPVTVNLPLQAMIFNRMIRSTGDDESKAVTRDANGDIIVAGLTYGDLDGNSNADLTHGTYDIFVTKLSPTGTWKWTKQFGTNTDDDAFGVAVDPGGNILITGATNSNLQGQVMSGFTDAYVTKLTSTGLPLWTRLTGTAGSTTAGNAIAVDSLGNAYVTGYTTGSLNGNVSAGSFDVFVTKFSSTGLRQWTAQQGTPLEDSGNGIALDAAGNNVYVTGHTYGGLKSAPAGTDYTNAGPSTTTDMFLMMFTASTGSWQRTKQLGTIDNDDAKAIAVDAANGSIYIAGGTAGNFGTANLGLYDMFLIKFDPAGNTAWTSPFMLGSAGSDIANAVTVDAAGNVLAVGQTSGTFDGIAGDGFNDLFIVRTDPTGSIPTRLWSREFGTRADDTGVGIVTSPSGTITVIGNTFGSTTSSATEDVFLLQYDSSGIRVQ